MGCHFLLQGIFPTQGRNLKLLHSQVFFTNWATYEAQLIVKEMQIKMVRMAIVKNLQTINAGKRVEKRELSCTLAGM